MSASLEIEQGKRLIEAFYAEPAFDLLRDSTRLFRLIHERFASQGLVPGAMTVYSGEGSLGDAYLQYPIPSAETLVQVYVSRMAITMPFRGGDAETLSTATDALGVTREANKDIKYGQYAVAVTAHGRLREGSVSEFLSSFVAKVPKLGQLRGAGCVFYFGPEGDTLSSSVTLDSSAVLDDGLFLATRANFDAERVPLDALTRRIREHTTAVLNAVGLRLGGG